MSTLTLQVVFPSRLILSVKVHSSDTARTVALSGPPLKQPVLLRHKGKYLSPYESLASQGVLNGDVIILYNVTSLSPPRDGSSSLDDDHGLVLEALRLADLAFLPYEVSACADAVYRQMWDDHKGGGIVADDAVPSATVVAGKPTRVSDQPLPSIWGSLGK
jgi:hypothetical protein